MLHAMMLAFLVYWAGRIGYESAKACSRKRDEWRRPTRPGRCRF